MADDEPRRNWLSRIIGHGPAARKRLGEAVAALLGTALVALGAIGGLLIWHLSRRGGSSASGWGRPGSCACPSCLSSMEVSTMRTMGFRPHERIKESGAFRRAFDRRRWESDAVMTIYGVENGLDHPRLGISVSRKKVKTAAARNRLKRLYREAFRLSKAELPAGLDLVIVPRQTAPHFADVRRSLPALARDVERRIRSRKP